MTEKLQIFLLLVFPLAVSPFTVHKHTIAMGEPDLQCDDGEKNLETDWDTSEANYTCYQRGHLPVLDLDPLQECFPPAKNYYHICMDQKINYPDPVPVFGDHRPLWAVYGEYIFLPPQRWVHNLEHGGIVMLYHPCADPSEVEKLRQIVTKCNSRHVITPQSTLPRDKPLVLLAYGCRFYMAHVDREKVVAFIKENVMKSPESHASGEGQYNFKLKTPALNQSLNLMHNDTAWCSTF